MNPVYVDLDRIIKMESGNFAFGYWRGKTVITLDSQKSKLFGSSNDQILVVENYEKIMNAIIERDTNNARSSNARNP